MFDAGKTRIIRLPYGEKNYDDMLSRFHMISERNGRTDGHTDVLYQYRASVCWRVIKILLKSSSLMQLITVTILLLIHGNPMATVFTKLYIYLYKVKRLSNMPKYLVIIHYLRRQLVIEPILVLNLVRARSSWLGLGTEPPADRSPNSRRIVWMRRSTHGPLSSAMKHGVLGREGHGNRNENQSRPMPFHSRMIQWKCKPFPSRPTD